MAGLSAAVLAEPISTSSAQEKKTDLPRVTAITPLEISRERRPSFGFAAQS
jgi:hypothetical protein